MFLPLRIAKFSIRHVILLLCLASIFLFLSSVFTERVPFRPDLDFADRFSLVESDEPQETPEPPPPPPPPPPPAPTPNPDAEKWAARAEEVKQAFVHAYSHYKLFAYPHDELSPLTVRWKDNLNGWGVTAIDSLDTMFLMGLHDEFNDTLTLIEQMDFSMARGSYVSFFETTIRYLGGLLSAYALSGRPILLQKADELATKLSPVFDSSSGLPRPSVNTDTGAVLGGFWHSLAEAASCQLEYEYLAHETGKKEYHNNSMTIFRTLSKMVPESLEMLPNRLSTNGNPAEYSFSVGAGSDSGHEYLLKYYLLTAQQYELSLDMYMRTMNYVLTHLLYLSPERSLLFVTDTSWDRRPSYALEHLSCFLPGLLALGVQSLPPSVFATSNFTFPSSRHDLLTSFSMVDLHLWAAVGLAETCWLIYADQPSGLGMEHVTFRDDSKLWLDAMQDWKKAGRSASMYPPGIGEKTPEFDKSKRDYKVTRGEYFLRPETIESIYYLWKVTGDERWRERGWSMFQALESKARNEMGYASLRVSTAEESIVEQEDEMPSYFLAETLKYLYLLFLDEDPVPLDKWVFNTEAHPLPIFNWSS